MWSGAVDSDATSRRLKARADATRLIALHFGPAEIEKVMMAQIAVINIIATMKMRSANRSTRCIRTLLLVRSAV
jgi:hypothetical protein